MLCMANNNMKSNMILGGGALQRGGAIGRRGAAIGRRGEIQTIMWSLETLKSG